MSQNIHPLDTSGNSQYQNLIRPAMEKARKTITTQQTVISKKFDQIRNSLSEKEKQINQELDEILEARLTELEMCAKNYDVLTSTLSISQQKLSTNTLGNINLKVVSTLSSAMEDFRNKMDSELYISILWGSLDIERSIQSICTVSYTSEANGVVPTALSNPYLSDQGYYEPSSCKKPEATTCTPSPHDLKEPLSVREIFPSRSFSTVPVTPGANLVPLDNQTSQEYNFVLNCNLCGSCFSSNLELERHQRENHYATNSNTNGQVFQPIREEEALPQSGHHNYPNHTQQPQYNQLSQHLPNQLSQHQPNPLASQHQSNPLSQHQPNQLASQHQPNPLASQHQPNPLASQHQPNPLASQHQPNQLASQHQPNQLSQHQPNQLASQHQPNPLSQHQPNPLAFQHQPNPLSQHQPNQLASQHQPNPLASQHQPNPLASQHQPNPLASQHQPNQLASQHQPNQLSQHQPNPLASQHQPNQLSQHQPNQLASQHQPNLLASQHQPNPLAFQHQPNPLVSHYQPNPLLSQHQPNLLASQHQPNPLVSQHQPNLLASQHQPNLLASQHQPNPLLSHYQPNPLVSQLPYPRVVTLPIQMSDQASTESSKKSVSQLQRTHNSSEFSDYRKYHVKLVWYKEVNTMEHLINYFDNFNGRCDLVWDKREESFSCMVELEEGNHFGQLILSDSEHPHPVERFSLPGLSIAVEIHVIILKIIPRS